MSNPLTVMFWESAEHLFFGVITLWLAGLTWKLWRYRAAIMRLQRDAGTMLEYLTQPASRKMKRVK